MWQVGCDSSSLPLKVEFGFDDVEGIKGHDFCDKLIEVEVEDTSGTQLAMSVDNDSSDDDDDDDDDDTSVPFGGYCVSIEVHYTS